MKKLQLTTIALLVVLLIISVYSMLFRGNQLPSEIAAQDVQQLAQLFDRINTQVKIIGFNAGQNPINFLTVASFEGAHVGGMSMLHPERWEGPYMKDDVTIQGKEYMVVRTAKGYFITPGQGVVLANGKKIGTDIVVDENADIAAMAQDPAQLQYDGKPLALPFPVTPAQEVIAAQLEQLHTILMKVHADCSIIGFDYQQNSINFLTVKKVAGSEVGALNMTYPNKWQGPYVPAEIMMQGKPYMVVRTKDGYFITPGNGVVLPNGKVIGKDLVLNEKANIPALLKDEQGLLCKGVPLARAIAIGKTGIAQFIEQNTIDPDESILD